MDILRELKKKIADIDAQTLAMEGCSPAFTVSEIMDLIDSMESAQEISCSVFPNSSDLISRQAAIDALDVLCQEHRYKIPGKRETYSQYNEAWQDALDRAEGAIGNLPSAQPGTKPIEYEDCANAMMMMWIDNVVTDGEYNCIMDKLNAHWGKTKNERSDKQTGGDCRGRLH